jgi:ribose 5-phosphate isomerase B
MSAPLPGRESRDLRVALACDHAGAQARSQALAALEGLGVEVVEMAREADAEDVGYPRLAACVARALLAGEVDRAILACGSGAGVAIAANRFPGIRAVVCRGYEDARQAREVGDINVLCVAGDAFPYVLRSTVQAFLETPFAGGHHAERLRALDELPG